MNGSVNTVTEYDLTQWLSPSTKSSSIVRADKQEPRLQWQSRQQRTCLRDSMAAGVDKTIMQQQCGCNKPILHTRGLCWIRGDDYSRHSMCVGGKKISPRNVQGYQQRKFTSLRFRLRWQTPLRSSLFPFVSVLLRKRKVTR